MCTFHLDTCEYAAAEHIDQILSQLREIREELVDDEEDESECRECFAFYG